MCKRKISLSLKSFFMPLMPLKFLFFLPLKTNQKAPLAHVYERTATFIPLV